MLQTFSHKLFSILTVSSSTESPPSLCNATHFSDKKQLDFDQRHDEYNRLQEKFNALTRDKNLLENRNTELNNMIKNLEEERDRLTVKLKGERKKCLLTLKPLETQMHNSLLTM